MDCSTIYNITQNDIDEKFQYVMNSNYIVGFLAVFAVGISSCYYIMIERKFNRLIDKIINTYPPLYSERA